MDKVDIEALDAALRWYDAGYGVLLVTVVRTWGSSPRPVGAMLAIREDGCVTGSVSGGCIEDDLIARVQREGIVQTRPEVLTYGIGAAEAHRFGLPCGGTLELVLEPVGRPSALHALRAAIACREPVVRRLEIASGHAELEAAGTSCGLSFDGRTLTTVHGPRYRMLVIGAGQLSAYLCRIAAGLDYEITVCDPRDTYSEAWTVQDTTLVRDMPDDVVIAMRLDASSAVIALTHDPKLDDLALMEALRTPAFYVGALGSRRNNAARRERLLEFDVSREQLARLHGPAGLYIGSRTPPEIALSILAELTAVRNGVTLPESWRIDVAKTEADGAQALRAMSDAGDGHATCAMR
ncbi:XdhC family protein [Burkholderia gladioli]|uniref:XdhC family protein n=1 Tax=Burkholderia gladioli TaxID=28095 RepID=UPI00164003DA|nr:XdhC family protein [Burkholderia gladioli]